MVYFNDILIYSKTKDEHYNHLNKIIEVLDREKLFGNLKKGTFFNKKVILKKDTFFTKKVIFLGYVVTKEGIQVNDNKVEAIRT